MKIKKLSILVPVFNEINTVGVVYEKLSKLNLGKPALEIVWVDDGSTDGTKLFLQKMARLRTQKLRNKFVFHNTNQGKGAAIKSGLGKVTGDFVIIQDADLEYDPTEIVRLVRKAESENLMAVYGSRDKEIRNKYLYPHLYWGSRVLAGMTNILFGQRLTDPETCYKLVSSDIVRGLKLSERGFGVEMEMSCKIAKLKIVIGEVSISYYPRSYEEGKKIGIKDGVRALWLVCKYYLSN